MPYGHSNKKKKKKHCFHSWVLFWICGATHEMTQDMCCMREIIWGPECYCLHWLMVSSGSQPCSPLMNTNIASCRGIRVCWRCGLNWGLITSGTKTMKILKWPKSLTVVSAENPQVLVWTGVKSVLSFSLWMYVPAWWFLRIIAG